MQVLEENGLSSAQGLEHFRKCHTVKKEPAEISFSFQL